MANVREYIQINPTEKRNGKQVSCRTRQRMEPIYFRPQRRLYEICPFQSEGEQSDLAR